jgi:hypothetical protein
MYFAALLMADLLPLGGWSDVRSKWLNAVADTTVCVVFLIAAGWSYYKRRLLSGLQSSLLCLIFGSLLVFSAQQLYTDMLFLQERRDRGVSGRTGQPNFSLHWTGSSRFSLFQWDRRWRLLPASELRRWPI